MNHTPEPWELREVDGLFAVANANGFVFEESDEQSRIDWNRVILCVNACKGATNEELLEVIHAKE